MRQQRSWSTVIPTMREFVKLYEFFSSNCLSYSIHLLGIRITFHFCRLGVSFVGCHLRYHIKVTKLIQPFWDAMFRMCDGSITSSSGASVLCCPSCVMLASVSVVATSVWNCGTSLGLGPTPSVQQTASGMQYRCGWDCHELIGHKMWWL